MDDILNFMNSNDQGLAQTDNPQTIGGQNLVNTPSNLQNSNASALIGKDKKIVSVGSSNFTSVNLTTSSSTASKPKTSNSSVYVWGMLVIVLVVVAFFVMTNMMAKKPPKAAAKRSNSAKKG